MQTSPSTAQSVSAATAQSHFALPVTSSQVGSAYWVSTSSTQSVALAGHGSASHGVGSMISGPSSGAGVSGTSGTSGVSTSGTSGVSGTSSGGGGVSGASMGVPSSVGGGPSSGTSNAGPGSSTWPASGVGVASVVEQADTPINEKTHRTAWYERIP